jgi:hypothetical protein
MRESGRWRTPLPLTLAGQAAAVILAVTTGGCLGRQQRPKPAHGMSTTFTRSANNVSLARALRAGLSTAGLGGIVA